MSTGALAARLQSALTPVTANLLKQVGSHVALYRATQQRQADGSTKRAWAKVAEGPLLIETLTAERAHRIWGTERTVSAQGTAPIALGIADGDGIVVVAGMHQGERFEVLRLLPDPLSGTVRVALGPTREVFP